MLELHLTKEASTPAPIRQNPSPRLTISRPEEEPASLDEISAFRNRLVDQRQKATETVSNTLRGVGTGLSLILYTFIVSPPSSQIWKSNKLGFLLASLCGVVCVLLDILQNFAERRCSSDTLVYLRDKRAGGDDPSPRELEEFRNSRGGSLAFGFLVLKAVLCLVGCSFVILIVAAGLNA